MRHSLSWSQYVLAKGSIERHIDICSLWRRR